MPWPCGVFGPAAGAIGAFIDAYNDRCRPFTWTKDADILIAKIRPSKNQRHATLTSFNSGGYQV